MWNNACKLLWHCSMKVPQGTDGKDELIVDGNDFSSVNGNNFLRSYGEVCLRCQ
jgi:hypothetical protein